MSPELNEYDELERLLWQELRPREAPQGFAERVMVRQARAIHARRLAALRWAMAALILIGIMGGYWKREHDARVAGEHARDQVMLALRMTAATLNDVEHKVFKDNKGETE